MTKELSGENANSGAGGQQVLLKVLNRCRVAPAKSSPDAAAAANPPQQAKLELTYFDMLFAKLPPVQRLFLYRLQPEDSTTAPHDVERLFQDFHLPRLKSALSHALAVFYPLAGRFLKPTDPEAIPFVQYEDGRDSVELTVAQSNDDFEEIAGDAPKQSTRLFPLVPTLEQLSSSQEESQDQERPLLAVQVTMFPGQRAVSIGVAVSHGFVDGSSSTHFLKTWAALSRQLHGKQDMDAASVDVNAAAGVLPIIDRSIVQDPKGLREIYFADLSKGLNPMESLKPKASTPQLQRATFHLSRSNLDVLRRKAAPPHGVRYSSFTVACALTWVCTVKARGMLDEPEKKFSFAANLRSRVTPPLPSEYFGNCLGGGSTQAGTADLVGDQGLTVAAAKIWKEIEGLHDGGILIRLGAELIKTLKARAARPSLETLSVAGSPGLGVYEVDYGWGRPVKVEVVSCEKTGGISLAEAWNGCGGVEVGVPLPPESMPEFDRLWRSALQGEP